MRSGAIRSEAMAGALTLACSLDDLIGARQECGRHRKAELLRRLEVDGQLEFGRLVERDIAGLCPAKNGVDVVGSAPVQFGQVEGISHQAPGLDGFGE